MRPVKTVFDGRELVIRLCAQYDMLKYTNHILALTFGAYSYMNKRILYDVTICISSAQNYWIDINTYKPSKINYPKFYLIAMLIAEKFKICGIRGVYRIFEINTLAYREISPCALKKRGKEIVKKLLLTDF